MCLTMAHDKYPLKGIAMKVLDYLENKKEIVLFQLIELRFVIVILSR